MSQFEQRFQGRNHVPGQLITAAELLEMQYLQYKTYCNTEADRYGLNPDGSFTPHVISGLAPSIVSGQHQIRIGRGQGFATRSLLNAERVALVLEEDLVVDLPAPNATNPFWVHVHLEAEPYTVPETLGSAVVAVKGVDDVIRNISTPLYFKMTTTVASVANVGTPDATPECPVMSSPHQLPIATVYIDVGDTGEIPAAQLYDVRWFAPGYGKITYTKLLGETAFTKGRNWFSAQEIDAPLEGMGGFPYGVVGIPNPDIFSLIPEMSPIISGMGADTTGAAGRLMSGNIVVTDTGVEHPIRTFTYAFVSFKNDGSGGDSTTGCPRELSIEFNPVV